MGRFKGKVALVTGATSGIGRATALAFAREGAQVVVTGRREAEGEQVRHDLERQGAEAVFVAGDVAEEADVERMLDVTQRTFGRLDCAFNNAGFLGAIAAVPEQQITDYEQTMRTNVLGTLHCMQHQLRAMLAAGAGAIVNNASLAGLVGSPENAVYDASKHAIVGLTRTAALEVARQGVRVNAVCASSVETAMDDHFRAGKGITRGELAEQMPIGRMCRPEEVAPAVLFLCSDDASYITGATLAIDGGFSAR